MMSRNKTVKVNSFPGATTEDMASYLNPLINRKPDHILLRVGTNNLATDSPQEIAENIVALTKLITVDVGTYKIMCQSPSPSLVQVHPTTI